MSSARAVPVRSGLGRASRRTEGRAPGDDPMVRPDALAGVLGGAGAESRLIQASDGVELHYLRWSSGPAPPRAVVVFLHGIASHGGWFGETAGDLLERGVAVYAPDRRGSGQSGGPRGQARDCLRRAATRTALRPDAAGPRPDAWGQSLTGPTDEGCGRAPCRTNGWPADSTDAAAVHGQPALPRLHPGRSAPSARGHGAVLLGDGTAGPPAPARLCAPEPPAPGPAGPGRRHDRRAEDAPLVRTARHPGQDLPGLSRRRPHPGLRAGPQPVPGRHARVAVGSGCPTTVGGR